MAAPCLKVLTPLTCALKNGYHGDFYVMCILSQLEKRQREQTFPAHGLYTTSPIWPLSRSVQTPGPPLTGWLWELKCVKPDGVAPQNPHPNPRRGAHPGGLGLHLYSSCTPETKPSPSLSFPICKGRAFLRTQFLWILGPMSGHKRLVIGSKGT